MHYIQSYVRCQVRPGRAGPGWDGMGVEALQQSTANSQVLGGDLRRGPMGLRALSQQPPRK